MKETRTGYLMCFFKKSFRRSSFPLTIHFTGSLFLLTLLFSCAQVVAPGGGKRDNNAPRVVKYSPDSAQLNFNSKTIELTFDEYIQLKDLNSQLIISPPLEKNPDIKVKNKTLIIDLGKQELKPNTTYSINFGNALQDINENNPKENFNYIFSTGNFIDSLKVRGKIQTAFDHKTEKGILVMLYGSMNDSAIYNDLPEYFARTTADGTFQINNVKQGTYKLLALKDVNANFKYDGEMESIAFIDTVVNSAEKKEIRVELFTEHAKKIYVKKYMLSSYGKILITFNEGSDSIRVKNLSKDKNDVQEFLDFSKNKDTLTYWLKNFDKDSLKLQLSNGNKIIDTLEFKMTRLEDALKSRRTPLRLSLASSPAGNQSFDIVSPVGLKFSAPVAEIHHPEKIIFKEDTSLYKTNHPLTFSGNYSTLVRYGYWDSSLTHRDANNPDLVIASPEFKDPELKENTKYHLFIPPGTFTDIFGLSNDSIRVDFKTRELKYYGSLKLKINVPELKGEKTFYQGKTETIIKDLKRSKYILQLLDDHENIIRQDVITQTETLTYNYLHPDKYHLKLIYDENGNEKWDTGNYLKKVQPEKVIYDPEIITIRSNWDAEIEWIIGNKK